MSEGGTLGRGWLIGHTMSLHSTFFHIYLPIIHCAPFRKKRVPPNKNDAWELSLVWNATQKCKNLDGHCYPNESSPISRLQIEVRRRDVEKTPNASWVEHVLVHSCPNPRHCWWPKPCNNWLGFLLIRYFEKKYVKTSSPHMVVSLMVIFILWDPNP